MKVAESHGNRYRTNLWRDSLEHRRGKLFYSETLRYKGQGQNINKWRMAPI